MAHSVLSDRPAKPLGRDNLFLWTVFLLLLAAVVFACWLGSFYVFGHPENPRAYRLLKRLNKLPPPARFLVTKAPPGEFLEAQRIFERYSPYSQLQLERENEQLFRNYLRNYSETKKLVPYLTGKFVILRAYELQRTDLFSCGVVALTQSVEFPQLLAEVIYPVKHRSDVPEMLGLLQSGLELRLQRTHDLSAILQVGHALDGRMQVTVVPLLYGTYALKNGFGSFALEPPEALNVGAGFPMVRGEEVRSVLRESARRKAAASAANQTMEPPGEIVRVEGSLPENPPPAEPAEPAAPAKLADATPKLPGLPAAPAPTTAPEPLTPLPLTIPRAEVVAAPKAGASKAGASKADAANPLKQPQAPQAPIAKAATPPAPSPVAQATPTPAPTMAQANAATAAGGSSSNKVGKTGPPMAAPHPASPSPQTAPATSSLASTQKTPPKAAPPPLPTLPQPLPSAAVPGKPLAQAAPKSAETSPEKSPTGVPLKPFIAAAPPPSTTQPTGTWKMVAPGRQPQGRSVTTEQASNLQGRNDSAPLYLHGKFVVTAAGGNRAVLRTNSNSPIAPKARVIVEYPAGGVPPQQGSSIAREDGRGFEIREVRRTPDGQVNIYVREVTSQ
jgi:hypothetical protein